MPTSAWYMLVFIIAIHCLPVFVLSDSPRSQGLHPQYANFLAENSFSRACVRYFVSFPCWWCELLPVHHVTAVRLHLSAPAGGWLLRRGSSSCPLVVSAYDVIVWIGRSIVDVSLRLTSRSNMPHFFLASTGHWFNSIHCTGGVCSRSRDKSFLPRHVRLYVSARLPLDGCP